MPRALAETTILITGATAGIGRAAALALASRGAKLILASRSEDRALPVLAELERATGRRDARFVPLDLADFASVRACAAQVNDLPGPLHVLVNNAGQVGGTGLTRDGFDVTLAANHLGPFLLTRLLLPKLRASAPARIVTVASRAHKRVRALDFAAFHRPRGGGLGLDVYSVSKLGNVLFTRALARRLAGRGVTAVCLHPGVIASDLWRHLPRPVQFVMKLGMRSNEAGARTIIHCVTAPDLEQHHGAYFADERPAKVSALAADDDLAERLWHESSHWVGLPDDADAAA